MGNIIGNRNLNEKLFIESLITCDAPYLSQKVDE